MTDENVSKVTAAKKDLYLAYEEEQRNYIQENVSIIEEAHQNQKTRLAWTTINEISGREKNSTGQRKAKSHKERVDVWKLHFHNLLRKHPVIDDAPVRKVFDILPIETNDFTMDELQRSIKQLKNNKAAGLDEIPAEVWKTGCLDQQLLDICNNTYHGAAPNIWKQDGIVRFPKKVNLAYTATTEEPH